MIEGLATFRRQRRPRRVARRRGRTLVRVAAAAACVAALVLGVLAIVELLTSPRLRVATIEISGCRRQPESSVRDLASAYAGEPILAIDISTLREAIEGMPSVEHASVSRILPRTLHVEVVERQPVARAQRGGETLLVDAAGNIFAPPVLLGDEDALPRVTGVSLTRNDTRLPERDRVALEALRAWKEYVGAPIPPETEVDVSRDDRIALRPGRSNLTIWLARDASSRNLRELIALRGRYGRLARAEIIDLRFPDRLIVVHPAGVAEGR